MRNVMKFQDLVKCQYGRKVAYTNASQITPQNVVKIVGNAIGIFNMNKMAIQYLWNYYKGDQPIRYRRKVGRDDIVNFVVENRAYEIVQFGVSKTYGEPIQFVSRKEDDKVSAAVDRFNDYMVDVDKQSKDIKAGEWQIATGTSFKAIQMAKSDIPFRIVAPTPLNTFIIYSSLTEEPILSVQELKNEDDEQYYLCHSINMQFVIKNSKVVSYGLHSYGDIPVVEFPNNWERLSDIEIVMDLLDTINNYQSSRIDSVEQFVQSFMKFVNCEIDEETFKKMKQLGAIVVKSNNGENKADVDIMTQELNQSESQIAKDDLWDSALEILGMPSRQNGASGGDTMGAISLREGWAQAKMYSMIKDPIIKTAEKRLGKIALNILRINKMDLGITVNDFDAQINHSPTDNMYTKTQALLNLLQGGISPLVAIKTVSLWGDAEKTYTLSKPYLDTKYKTVEMLREETEKQQLTGIQQREMKAAETEW